MTGAGDRRSVAGLPVAGRRRGLAVACALALGPWVAGRAAATRFPARTVRIVAPQAPGGPTDTLARIAAQHFAARWKESVVVENPGGAGGAIGARVVADAAGDGHTLLLGSNAVVVVPPAGLDTAGFDPLRTWAPIGGIARVGYVLAVRPGLGVTTLGAFVAQARTRPEALSVATVGPGSNSAKAVALLERAAGITLLSVPFKGAAPALQAVVGEHVDAIFCDLVLVQTPAGAGAVRLLAACGRRRLALAPDLPTFAEAGVAGVVAEPWFGLVAPKGTPAAVVSEIAAALHAMRTDPEVVHRFASLGYEAIADTPEAFAAAIAAEQALVRSLATGGEAPRPAARESLAVKPVPKGAQRQ
jgi:tripartite-type tricarboxylate transporter receptor subunit TctC